MGKKNFSLFLLVSMFFLVLTTACVANQTNETSEDNTNQESQNEEKTQEETSDDANNETSDKKEATNADYTLSFAIQSPATDNPEHNAAILFKEYIEAQSGGAIAVDLFPGGQLGDERETFEAVRAGNIDFATQADGAISGFVEEINVLSIPYLFRSAPVAWEVLEGSFGQKLKNHILAETGVRPLGISQNGFRSFSNNAKPIETLEDLKGLKIRVMESQLYLRMVESLGAQAVPMAGGDELYSALQQGVVDGQENPVDIIYSFNIHEVQDYITVDNHTYGSALLVTNDEKFKSLPVEYQEIIVEAANVWTSQLQGPKEEVTIKALQLLEEEGTQINYLSTEELERFREVTQPRITEWLEENIESSWIESILAAVEEAEAKIYGD